jgi:acyl carrier protein
MKREDIKVKLNDIFKLTLTGDKKNIEYGEEANLTTDLGLNSVGILYMVIAIEEYFNVRFDDVSFGDFETVKDVIDFIEKNLD